MPRPKWAAMFITYMPYLATVFRQLYVEVHTIIEAISLERFRERRARGQTGAEAGNHHHYRAILFRLWYELYHSYNLDQSSKEL